MVQATTPTFKLTIQDVDLTQADKIVFTLESGIVQITKDKDDMTVEQHVIYIYLSQEETRRLQCGKARIQVNWTYADGSRSCTNIESVDVSENLNKAVI